MNELEGDASAFAKAGFGAARPRRARPRLSRQIVFCEMLDAEHPVRAHELARRIEPALGRSVSVNSVYRILALLASKGLVVRIECLKAWMPVSTVGPSLHLACSACGVMLSVSAATMADQLVRLAARRNFLPRRLVIENLGLCSRCASQASTLPE